jgi:uncharacterized protein YkwD
MMVTTIRYRAAALVFLIWFATSPDLRAQDASGRPLGRLLGRLRSHQTAPAPSTPVMVAAATPSAQAAADCPCEGGSDPYGFTTILNQLRARAGLHPLSYDPDLSSWASQNNAAQCRRGLGHHVNPCGVQNCGWNYNDANAVAEGWMNSPGHRQNLLSPSVSRFGLAFGPGPYWTFNAR